VSRCAGAIAKRACAAAGATPAHATTRAAVSVLKVDRRDTARSR
jgi:hypothetical protein